MDPARTQRRQAQASILARKNIFFATLREKYNNFIKRNRSVILKVALVGILNRMATRNSQHAPRNS
jgi:hypothetical protein